MTTPSIMNLMTELMYSDDPRVDDLNAIDKPMVNIFAQNGLFHHVKGPHSSLLKRVADFPEYFENKCQSLPALTESITLKQDTYRQIPQDALLTVLSFYRGVHLIHGTEAQVNFYYNVNQVELPDIPGVTNWGNDLISYVPKQTVSVVNTTTDDPHYHWFREKMIPFLETHSHHTMDAFESGTDRANSRVDGFQLVFGHIFDEDVHLYNWVTCSRESLYDLPLSVLQPVVDTKGIRGPKDKQAQYLNIPKDLPEVPEDWFNQLEFERSSKSLKFYVEDDLFEDEPYEDNFKDELYGGDFFTEDDLFRDTLFDEETVTKKRTYSAPKKSKHRWFGKRKR